MVSAASRPDEVAALKRQLASRDELIAKLMHEIARLKRWQFGRSAERVAQSVAQLQLALDDLQAQQKSAEVSVEAEPASEDSSEAPVKQRVIALRRAARSLSAKRNQRLLRVRLPNIISVLERWGTDGSRIIASSFQLIKNV